MRFTVVTLFPAAFDSLLAAGVLGKAIEAGVIEVDFVDPRDFTTDKHRTVDDAPYGGGHGMVMKVEPVVAAIEHIGEPAPHRILMSPAGSSLTQGRVRELADIDHIALICGRYEGIDERAVDLVVDESLSIGDFVMTGGEVAAMAIIDSVARYVPGVLGEAESAEEESFTENLIEYPHYTRPREFRGLEVPEPLLSGNHERIRRWRRQRSLERTQAMRPDLFARHRPSEEDRELAPGLGSLAMAARTYIALAHHPVYDRTREIVTSSVTNLDIHDIARSAATYGLAGYFAISPVTSQRDKIERITEIWQREIDVADAKKRGQALATVRAAASIETASAAIESEHGSRPLVVATSARPVAGAEPLSPSDLHALTAASPERPILLLFGTGFGLTDEIIDATDHILMPIYGPSSFNHLSVRSAAAVMLDRLFGT